MPHRDCVKNIQADFVQSLVILSLYYKKQAHCQNLLSVPVENFLHEIIYLELFYASKLTNVITSVNKLAGSCS